MSQLNPDAAEFVPVSPTRAVASPTYVPELDDKLLAQSPRRALPMDINVPSPVEFQSEVKNRPSEVFDEFDKCETQNVRILFIRFFCVIPLFKCAVNKAIKFCYLYTSLKQRLVLMCPQYVFIF